MQHFHTEKCSQKAGVHSRPLRFFLHFFLFSSHPTPPYLTLPDLSFLPPSLPTSLPLRLPLSCPLNPAGSSRRALKAPQRGLRRSPDGKRFLVHFQAVKCVWLQQCGLLLYSTEMTEMPNRRKLYCTDICRYNSKTFRFSVYFYLHFMNWPTLYTLHYCVEYTSKKSWEDHKTVKGWSGVNSNWT